MLNLGLMPERDQELAKNNFNYGQFINFNDGSRSLTDKGKLVLRYSLVSTQLSHHYNPHIQFSAGDSYLARLLLRSKELKAELKEYGISPRKIRRFIAPRVSELSRVPLAQTSEYSSQTEIVKIPVASPIEMPV